MTRSPAILATGALLALAACGSEPATEPAPTQSAAGPRTLVSAGFNDQQLGPSIVGPQGAEITGELAVGGRAIADIVSYVACPAPAEDAAPAAECVPEDQPDGAIYTYVHRVTPRGITGDEGVVPLTFRTTRPAWGFANAIGYDRQQAEAALGGGYAIGVQQDNGALIWRIELGDGWSDGEEITFFWQSTLPPEGPAQAYAIETIVGDADGVAPFPAEPAPAEPGIAGAPG